MPIPSPTPASPVSRLEPEYDVILIDAGPDLIQVLKNIRQITGLGLSESKTLMDSAPIPIREGMTKNQAEFIKTLFEEVGATAEVRRR